METRTECSGADQVSGWNADIAAPPVVGSAATNHCVTFLFCSLQGTADFYQTGFSFSSDIGAFVGSKIWIIPASLSLSYHLPSTCRPPLARLRQFSLCSPLICRSEVNSYKLCEGKIESNFDDFPLVEEQFEGVFKITILVWIKQYWSLKRCYITLNFRALQSTNW